MTFAQGRRDIDGNKYVIYNFSDTSKFKFIDSTQLTSDTIKRAPVDSTARLKYFQYFPEYIYGIKIKEKTHPLLLENSTSVKTEISFDSTNNVTIRQTFMGEDIKAPAKVQLNRFLESLTDNNSKKIFSDIFAEKFKGNVSDDLTKLFEKFTDITIPLPFKTETIFGPPTFNLRINGAVDITASYQNITSDQVVVSYLSNSQNNINFKQDVQVTAKGTVGDKLTIDADWNTQRTFDFENQLKLKYTGYADEVIKSIEAGNVSLDTKSSLIQSTQALFGVKGEFKLGPLNISTVISQKKSKQETKDYTGGSSQQEFSINVYDYSDNHYFFDTLYKSSFLDYMNSQNNTYTTQTVENQILINDTYFEVWVQSEITEPQKRFAVAYTLLKDTASIDYDTLINSQQEPGIRAFGYFRKLNPNEFYVNPFAGFISLKVNVPDNYAVGVSYRTFNQKKFGRGSYDAPNPDTMILKMVKCANQNPETTPDAWELKMKNVYRLPVSKIIEDGFKLEILYNRDNNYEPSIPSIPDKLIKITGLDRYTGKGFAPPPDGAFDYLTGLTIIPETGDVIFPSLRPFYDNLQLAGADSTFQYKDLYIKRKSEAINSPLANKYIIKGSAKGEAGISNTINLGFNVVQGSVKVLIGTQELQNNVDYSVDYSTGVLVIRSASALTSQNLKITYETNDLFSIASKILIGARADYKFSEKTNLGFTFMNLKQETLNDKVRIGEEPTNNSVFGLDFGTEIKTNFLTKLINYLPGFNTKEESAFRFKGEFAYMTPQPNTKKSRIPQDNNESIAYIDDMEGAKKTIPLGSTFNQWTISSIPFDSTIGLVDSIRQFKRGRMKWYNIPNDVEIKQIYPLRDVQPGQDRLTPFYISFDPKQRSIYNYNGHMDTIENKKNNWNGIMRYLNTTSTDLINENINYIEFNMRVDGHNAALNDGVIVIELGQISEDAIPNGILNTEDKNQNGTLQDDEDIGLDFLTNAEELAKYNQINNTNLTLSQLPDPALDDNGNAGTNTNLDVINGTENNRGTEGGNRPDTEDLNRNGMLDYTTQSYFTYTISLDTVNNKRISGRGEPGSGWFQYRIPLSEFTKKINNPSLNNIDYARIWIKGINDSIRIALVDLNLVGNQWIKPNKNDTTYNISVVSIEENPQIYQSPVAGDILRQTIRNTSGVNTKSNEQSLALQVNNLSNGGRKFAVKDYRTQTIDLFNYKTLKLFINGDPSFNYVNENIYDAAMVIRFGSDSSNYYEYRAPIHPDVRPGQPWNSLNEVSIVFSDLTTIKLARDSVNQVVDVPVPNGPPGSIYRIKGNPALNTIRDFELGIEKNKTGLNATITGSVWFNEIRVLKVVDDNGYAMNINAGLKISDVADFSFNFSKIDPNYHSLDTRIGSRVTGQSWDINMTLNAHKFINNALVSILSEEWKDFLYLPITFRHSENLANPKYYPGTDIDIDKAAAERYRQVFIKTGDAALAQKAADDIRIESQALMVRNEFSVNGLNFKFPGNNYLVKTLLNSFTINFNGNLGNQRDFTYQSKTDFTYTGAMNFKTDFGLADLVNLKIGKLINLGDEYKDAKLYLMLPFIPLAPLFSSDFNAAIDFNRTRNEGRQRRLIIDDPIARQFSANRGFSFNWKFIENWIVDLTGNYSFKVGSDLAPFETYGDSLNTARAENEIFKQIFFNEALINFGRDLNYQQTTVFNPKFNIPIIKKFMDITGSYNVTYGWNNPNTSTNIGYSVGYNNKIQATTNFKLKDLIGLFKKEPPPAPLNKNLSKGLRINDDNPGIGDLLKLLTTFIPENISVAYNQDNTVLNPGVQGRPGFGNFWMVPGGAREEFGPSRMYQLGFSMFPGKRVPGLQLTDNFAQLNNLTLTATITPLIPQNIRVNLTFKSNWGAQNSASYISDPEGSLYNPTSKSSNSNKSYTIFFAGNVDKFDYVATEDLQSNTQNISSAFKSQLSSMPFPNWSLSISGVEKIPFFSEFASSVSIENSYTSEYSEAYSLDFRGLSIPQRQGVTQSFSPLLGLNITFKEAFGGNLTASFRINNSKSNILTPTSNLIQVTNTNDWSINANYSKAGFEIPFFGLSLKNDIAFALTISKNVTDPTDYKYSITGLEKAPGSGSAVTTINPSIQYSLSSKVQMQLFFKYIRTEPTQQSANIVPRTSKEGGLNIRIQIQ